MKTYLLVAGSSYYPGSGTDDWIACYDTHQDARNQVTIIHQYREITKGERKGEKELEGQTYKIQGSKYDWY